MDRLALAAQASSDLMSSRDLRRAAKAQLPNERLWLRAAWRTRIAKVHQSALSDRATANACAFFLSDIYPPEAQAWRDSQALDGAPKLCAMLPEPAALALAHAIELDLLTERIDSMCCKALSHMDWDPADDTELIDRILLLPGASARHEQAQSMRMTATCLARLSATPLISTTLKAMRLPAHLSGLSDLQDFLERGLAAFKTLPDPIGFCDALALRERTDFERAHFVRTP
jgi:hypothetical protein